MAQDSTLREMFGSSVMLLLGSGVSLPSGLKGIRALTDHVLNSPHTLKSSGRFVPSDANAPQLYFGQEDEAGKTQQFLKLLKAYADRYYSVRTGQESNYEDIYYLARQISDDSLTEVENPAIDGFLREIRAHAEPLMGAQYTPDKYQKLAERACSLITDAVARELRTPGEIKG
jgi:hypothetical protein